MFNIGVLIMNIHKNKKGQMGEALGGLSALVTVVLLFVVIGMISAFGSQIVDDTQNDFITGAVGCNATVTTSCGQAFNNSGSANEGIGNITAKMPTVGTVLIGAFIILILVSAFAVFMTRR